jgi:hypothetical protein
MSSEGLRKVPKKNTVWIAGNLFPPKYKPRSLLAWLVFRQSLKVICYAFFVRCVILLWDLCSCRSYDKIIFKDEAVIEPSIFCDNHDTWSSIRDQFSVILTSMEWNIQHCYKGYVTYSVNCQTVPVLTKQSLCQLNSEVVLGVFIKSFLCCRLRKQRLSLDMEHLLTIVGPV